MSRPQFIYIADPMCSWCWGFQPVVRSFRNDFGDHLDFRLVLGGLRPGAESVMDDRDKSMIRHHWEEVQKRTGQPFDFSFFERNDFVYDTELPSRAIVTTRALAPDLEWPLFYRLQEMFYAKNEDVTDPLVLEKAVKELNGSLKKNFMSHFLRKKGETLEDFRLSQKWGIRGFPSVVLQKDQELVLLAHGYQPYEPLADALWGWLQGEVTSTKN